MDDLNIRLKAILDTVASESNIKKQTKQIEETLTKTPIQMRIEANTGIAMQEMSKSAKAYQQVWEKAFYNQKQQAIKNAEEIKNAYNSQLFQNFNKSIGIGQNTGITESNSALKQYYETINKLNKVSTIPTSEVIENTFSSNNTNKITKQNSALAELFETSSKSKVGMSALQKEVVKLNPAMAELNKTTEKSAQSFSSILAKIGLWGLATSAIYTPIRSFREAIDTIYELDTAITDLKKVADELGSSTSIEKFTAKVNQMAIEVGHSTKDAIDSVAEFKRTGFSLGDSETLAKQAMIYSNIGDVDISESTKSIVSTLKGFNLTAQDTIHIMDAYNEVGNNFSISSEGIGSALQRSSSALYEANNSLEESIGLIVAGNASIQNPEKVGNGLKTVSMRLRGISDDADEVVPKLDKLIKTTTGVDIMKDNNTFKSTYEILLEISKVWKNLDDTTQANLLEKMFGKQQGAVGASILNNMVEGANAMATAVNSVGSSAKEQEAYMTSLQAKINKFHETVTKQWTTIINTDFIKGLVDDATKLVEVLGNLVNDPMTKFIAVASLGALTGKALLLTFTALSKGMLAYEGYCIAVTFAEEGLIASTKMLTASLLASPLFLGALAFGAMYGVAKLIDNITVSFAEQKKVVDDLTGEVQSLQSEYDQLSSKNFLTDEEQKKLKILEQQLKTKKDILALEQKEANEKYVEEYTQSTDGFSGFRQIDKNNIEIEKYKNNLKELKDIQSQLDKETNADKRESLQDDYEKLSLKVEKTKASFEELYQTMTDEKSQGAEFTSDMEEQYNILGSLINATNQSSNGNVALANSYGLVSDALDKVTEKKALTKKETDQLVTLYPELADVVSETSDGFYIEADALSNLSDTARQSAISQINTQITLTKNIIDQTKKRISAMQLEAQAQQKIANISAGSNSTFEKYASKMTGKNIKLPTDSNVNSIAQDNLTNLEGLLAKLNSINAGGSSTGGLTSSGDKDSSSKPSAIEYTDPTQAIVDTINQQVKLDNLKNSQLETELKIAENQKDYTKQIELQNQLLNNQNRTVLDLKIANDKIHAQAESVRSKTKYNTESWFNADNTDTTSYLALLNSFAGKTDDASKNAVEKIKAIHDQLKTLKDGWISNKDAIDSMNSSIQSVSDTIDDLTRKAVETVSDMEDEIVKMWEAEYDEKLDDLKDWYDDKKDLAEQDYDDEKKVLDDKLDNFRKYIEEQKQILNRSFDEDKFNEELSEKQDELAELQKKFNELSLSASSGDRVAISKQSDIGKEISDKQKEIDDLVAERSKTIQENALDDSLNDYEEYIDNKKSVLDEEYESELRNIERSYNKKVEKLKAEYDKEKLYSDARQMLISGEYGALTTLYEEYQKNQGEGWSSLGSILESEYLAKLREASAILSELDGKGISTSKLIKAIGGDSSNSSNGNKYADSNGNAPKGTQIGDVVLTAGNHAFKVVGYGDTTATTGGQYNSASGLTSIKLYDTGGQFKNGDIAKNLSGKPEWVLNPDESEALIDWLTKAPDLMSSMNVVTSNIPNNISTVNTSTNTFQIDSLVTFNGDTSGLNISDVKSVVNDAFKQFGKQLNSGNPNFKKGAILL